MIKEFEGLLLLLLVMLLLSSPAFGNKSERKPNGAKLFAEHCAKCHVGGGNIVKSSHPVAGSQQLSSILKFKAYLSLPPGHMPYYQDIVNNKQKLESLYQYCRTLKEVSPKQASSVSVPTS
jgi:mono/diheme cytochrome c family protein